MTLKDCVETIFGYDGDERVLHYFLEKELAGCKNEVERWYKLYEKCDQWKKEFLLWEAQTFIHGINGWNVNLDVCRLRLPEGAVDWMAYLYHVMMGRIINDIAPKDRDSIAQAGQQYENFTNGCWTNDFIVESGYAELTREQWLAEVTEILEKSWARYDGFEESKAPKYAKAMRENYPKFRAILEYLERNIGECEIARMNQHGGDETVWYLVLTEEELYLMRVSDAM